MRASHGGLSTFKRAVVIMRAACTVQVNVDKLPTFKEYLGKCQPVFLFYKVRRRMQARWRRQP